MDSFLTARDGHAEVIISKSRFIGFIIHIKSEEAAAEELKRLSKIYHDATHICYAYIVGENAEFSRFSDSGEPSGTAGLPILSAIKNGGYNNVLAAVVRYFGGTKLGTGGLSRAYSECASKSLANAKKSEVKKCAVYKAVLSLSDYSRSLNFLNSGTFKTLSSDFGENAVLTVAAPAEFDFITALTQKTNGKAETIKCGEELIEF